MLVGSGGVIALVLGAWAVLWALAAVPGAHWRSFYPALAAFVAAIFAAAMVSAQSEIVLGTIDWARAAPDERKELVTYTMSLSWRPLAGAAVALAVAAAVVAVVARLEGATDAPNAPRHWSEHLLAWSVPPLMVADGIVWIALRQAFDRAVSAKESLPAAASQMELLSLIGTVDSGLLVFVAVLIGIIRMFRA